MGNFGYFSPTNGVIVALLITGFWAHLVAAYSKLISFHNEWSGLSVEHFTLSLFSLVREDNLFLYRKIHTLFGVCKGVWTQQKIK